MPYDTAGNMTSDGLYNYAYDAEGHQTSAAGVTYTYDGLGRRIKKSNGTVYWYGGGGQVLYETDLSGTYLNDYIFFGGQRLARVTLGGAVYNYFGDMLGSSRVIVWFGQNTACYDADFYAFGGEKNYVNTCAQNYKFTGMERDAESGNDHTEFRQFMPNFGRWMSPDPLAGDVTNPQSLNRYAYVLNNPCSLVDPLGLDACSFNTHFSNQAGQNLGVAEIEAVIQQIFAASSLGQPNQVGVNFVTGGQVNFTLTYNNNGEAGGHTGRSTGENSGEVYANLFSPSVYLGYTNTFLGVIGAHEMGHGLAGVKDLAFQSGDVPTLMSIDNNPSWYNPVYNGSIPNGLLFTPDQVEAMFHRCPNKHPSVVPLPLGGGDGGGQGGGDRGQWQMTIGNCGTTSEDGGQGWTCDIGYTWVPFPIQRK